METNQLYYAEVLDVSLNDNDPEYQTYIKCKLLEKESIVTARAINKQIKYIPINGELVLLVYAPSAYYSKNERLYEFYYLFSINLHENINHNSLFNATTSYQTSYDQKSNDIKFGMDFKEKSIPDVQSYEGDNIIQGRFGNVIRLSKTNVSNNLNHPSTWVKSNDDYNPIITITNNLKQQDLSKNKHTTENINEDGSSIYITYKQKVNIDLSSPLFESFRNKPKQHNEYGENQIIENSDRITLNAKKDGVFINGKKFISLSSDDSVNIDSKGDTIINSDKTYVGSKDATEPFLYGDKTDSWLNELLGILNDILTSLSVHNHGTGVGPSTPPLPPELPKYIVGGLFPNQIELIQQKIIELKSKVNFVT